MTCTTPVEATAKPCRCVRWISSQVADRLGCGQSVILEVEMHGVTTCYALSLHVDVTGRAWWKLCRPEQDADGFESVIEYTLGQHLESCTCPAARYRGGVCKHARFLRAALARAGYQP